MLLLIPLASNSEAMEWDLQILANVENSPMYSGDRPIVTGVVLDQASKPVQKASVNIRSETMSIFTTTSQSGEFQAELGKHERIPGSYLVNISATDLDGNTGYSSIQFQIRGEILPTDLNQAKLSSPEAKKYLNASSEDFENDPIGFMLFNYYQKIYQDYLKNEEAVKIIEEEKILKEQQKAIADKNRLDAIEEFNPSYGIFSGPEYENYVNSLDDEVRDTVIQHLSFTKTLFIEAQILRNTILENGGTAEEAQKAYLEKLTVTRDTIENFELDASFSEEETIDNMNKRSDNRIANETRLQPSVWESSDDKLNQDQFPTLSQDPIWLSESNSQLNQEQFPTLLQDPIWLSENSEESSQNSPIQVDVDGVNVEVSYSESIFSVIVNGTILEFLVNGIEITQVNTDQ